MESFMKLNESTNGVLRAVFALETENNDLKRKVEALEDENVGSIKKASIPPKPKPHQQISQQSSLGDFFNRGVGYVQPPITLGTLTCEDCGTTGFANAGNLQNHIFRDI
jgi:hypothetical protein